MEGSKVGRFFADQDGQYRYHNEDAHILMKVETHNHPTAISPFPVPQQVQAVKFVMRVQRVRGAKPKAGLTGFSVSNLIIQTLNNLGKIHFPNQTVLLQP